MNEPIPKTPASNGRGASVKPLALLSIALFVGISLWHAGCEPQRAVPAEPLQADGGRDPGSCRRSARPPPLNSSFGGSSLTCA
jgi:hypothetical protein